MSILPKLADVFRLISLRDEIFFRSDSLDMLFKSFRLMRGISSLDIGCGFQPKNPFCAEKISGLDLNSSSDRGIIAGDLSSGNLPFPCDCFDYVTAFDVLEHIPRVSRNGSITTFPFVDLMREIHRILKPEGIFFSSTPCYPFKEAFQDPTHVNIMTEDTLRDYFSNDCWATIYGFKGEFDILKAGWFRKRHFVFLRKRSSD